MIAGFDEYHMNAERPHLQPQCFAETFQREFGSAVEALKRNRDESADGSNIDDVTGFLLPHDRQHGAAHSEGAEKVHLELMARFLDGGVLNGSRDSEAGIVNQCVDPPLAREDGFDCAGHGLIVSDIQGESFNALRGNRAARSAVDTKAVCSQEGRTARAYS